MALIIPYERETVEKIKKRFVTHQFTLAVAESVTSGHIQVALACAKDASLFFQGGITVYNVGQKTRHLQVEPIHAIACDCVSDEVSTTMAKNICSNFFSDVGVGITGYAAPVPEKGIKDLFAWYAIAVHGKVIISKKIIRHLLC